MAQEQPTSVAAYEDMSYDDLVTYTVYRLTAGNGSQTTFEDIVAEAFRLFPQRFGLRGYPEWPDSAVVNKSWLRSRTDKKYIVGSVKDGFRLTLRGLQVAQRVEQRLGKTPTKGAQRIKSELRTRSGRLLRSIEESQPFLEFKEFGQLERMTEDDFADILLAMPDTPARILASNLEQFRDAATLYDRRDVQDFLDALQRRFSGKLGAA